MLTAKLAQTLSTPMPGDTTESACDDVDNVVPLDIDWGAFDEHLDTSLDVLFGALRRRVVGPALRTQSRQEFVQLLDRDGTRIMDILRSIDVVIREAVDEGGLRKIFIRMPRAERRHADALADLLAAVAGAHESAMLKDANALVSRARKALAEFSRTHTQISRALFHGYRDAILFWQLGLILCMTFVRAKSGLLPANDIRDDAIHDIIEVTNEGAMVAGIQALKIAGVELRGEVSATDWQHFFFDRATMISFLLDAHRRAQELFGPEARVFLTCYEDSEAEGTFDSYFAISTTLPPRDAVEVFDHFCEWWDEESRGDERLSRIHPTLEHHEP